MALASLVAWCILALGVQLAAQPLEAISIMAIPLSYYAGAQGILIGFVLIAFLFVSRQRRLDRTLFDGAPGASISAPAQSPETNGTIAGTTGALAMAGDWLSGATLVALAGALYTLGHDGLGWLVGLFGGLVLLATLIGPHVHRGGSKGVVDYIHLRFGMIAGCLALLVAALAVTLVLGANLQVIALAMAMLLPDVAFASQAAIAIGAGAFLVAAARGSNAGVTVWQAIAYPLILAVLTLPVVVTASGIVPGHFTFGAILKNIGATELRLLEKELADPVTLKVFTRPFTTATPFSTILLTLSLALGLAAMPSVLKRPALARSREGARLMPAVALLLILIAAMALPPLAASMRLAVLTFADHSVDALPDRLLQLGSMGLVDICGVKAVSQAAVVAACDALQDPITTLRLDDIVIARDHALFAAPLLAGLPDSATLLLAGVTALASLFAAAWLGRTLGAAATCRSVKGGASVFASVSLVALAAAGAVFLVLARTADVMTLLAWGLAVSAAGLAPVLLAGVWSMRATAAGAILGMLAGVGLTLYYIVATRYFAPAFYELWSVLSSAGYGSIADLEAAREALAQATASDEQQAARQVYVEAARAVANWWGLRDTASGALGAAFGFLVLVLVSLVTPRPDGVAVALMSRTRGLVPRV